MELIIDSTAAARSIAFSIPPMASIFSTYPRALASIWFVSDST